MNNTDFQAFPKLHRLSRNIVITEKLDGTNAQVVVTQDGTVRAGSRNRWIEVGDDNFGFAAWVNANQEELRTLGVGRHFGEWWGKGIQRGYGLEEKRFSLFNTNRWYDHMEHKKLTPACCDVVPVLYMGPFDMQEVDNTIKLLADYGSRAAPKFMDPEGIVVFHTAANMAFKKTIKNDEVPKSMVKE